VISPPLDAAGNSVRAQKVIADISAALGGNPYSVRRLGTAAGDVMPLSRR
jgi:glutaminase